MSLDELIYVIIVHIMVPVCSLVTYVFWLKDNLKTERRYREYAQNKFIATRDALEEYVDWQSKEDTKMPLSKMMEIRKELERIIKENE